MLLTVNPLRRKPLETSTQLNTARGHGNPNLIKRQVFLLRVYRSRRTTLQPTKDA
jgi:hypothetical protein